jgi:hypothetical protein
MKTLSASQITELHATRTTKGAGFAPSLAECLAAAADGRLYDVDTQNRGADCLTIAEHEDAALSEIAEHEEPDLSAAHPEGAAAWARDRRWTAERISLGGGRLADLNPRDVGRDAARRLVEHLAASAVRLSPAVTVDVYAPRWRENALPAHGAVTDEVLDGTDLALSASALCEYAQRGGRVWDWEGHEDAADAAHELVSVLSPDLLGCEEASLSGVLLGLAEPQKSVVSEGDSGRLKLPDSVRLAVMGTGVCGPDGRMKDVVISGITISMKEAKREDR